MIPLINGFGLLICLYLIIKSGLFLAYVPMPLSGVLWSCSILLLAFGGVIYSIKLLREYRAWRLTARTLSVSGTIPPPPLKGIL